jgi:Ser/Thr protein kinase RdoA (MazF antagonist)
MAVSSQLPGRVLEQHLRAFGLGDVIESRGVHGSSVNTFVEVTTTRGRFVLRIHENRTFTDARFEEALILHLGEQGLAVPHLVAAGRYGYMVPITARRQLSVFQHAAGREMAGFEVTAEHAREVGHFLGSMHNAVRGLTRRRRHRFDKEHLSQHLESCALELHTAEYRRDIEKLRAELPFGEWGRELTRGIIHTNVTLRNARFARQHLLSVIDFDAACTGPFVYDVAMALAEWAYFRDTFFGDRARALVLGYETARALKPADHAALYGMCRFALARLAITCMLTFEIAPQLHPRGTYRDYRHYMERLAALDRLGVDGFMDTVLPKSLPADGVF